MTKTQATELSEPLAWDEICRRYPDQWVALVEIEWIDDDEIRLARVAGAGPRRADPLAHARALHSRYEEIGHFYTEAVRAPTVGQRLPPQFRDVLLRKPKRMRHRAA